MMGTLIFLMLKNSVFKGDSLVLLGKRNQIDGFWDTHLTYPVPLLSPVQSFHPENAINCKNKSKKELDKYLQASFFIPNLTTFADTI